MNIVVRRTVQDDADKLAEIQRKAFLPIYEKYQDTGSPCLRGKEDILPKLLLKKRFLYFTERVLKEAPLLACGEEFSNMATA